MQRKQLLLASFIKIVTCAAIVLTAVTQSQAADKKADPTGTWSWIGPVGPRKNTAKLQLEGEKVSGTISFPVRGGQTTDSTIEDGKLTRNEISFKATREMNGNKLTIKYSGKVSAETIEGKMEYEMGGQPQSRKWDANRQAENK
jgi:hypothetical protein